MLKNIWAKLSYIWFVFMLFFVGLFVGFDSIYAATTNWSLQQARIQTDHQGTDQWSTWRTISGTSSYVFSSSDLSYPVNSVAYKFQANQAFTTDDNVEFLVGYRSDPDSLGFINIYVENSTTGVREDVTITRAEGNNGWKRITVSFEPHTDYSAGSTLYVKINFYESYVTDFRVAVEDYKLSQGLGSVIKNQTNIIINQNTEINNSINNMNDTMQDDTVDNPNNSFTEFENMLATNGTITNLLLLPITFFTSVVTNLNSSCQPMILGELYGTNLSMACINIGQYLGNTLWSLIDLILSGTFVVIIARKFIKVFNNMSSLKEGDVIGD